jgi:hypothetical protein
MNLAASWIHAVLGADSTNQQGIGDERAMTAPKHRFGAHQYDSLLVRQLDQFVDALLKFRRLHVIRITSKGSIAPAQVELIAPSMTQPADYHGAFQCSGNPTKQRAKHDEGTDTWD